MKKEMVSILLIISGTLICGCIEQRPNLHYDVSFGVEKGIGMDTLVIRLKGEPADLVLRLYKVLEGGNSLKFLGEGIVYKGNFYQKGNTYETEGRISFIGGLEGGTYKLEIYEGTANQPKNFIQSVTFSLPK